MRRQQKILSIGHSYVVAQNRRLAAEMARVSRGTWAVTVAAPTYFHGTNDLRPCRLTAADEEGAALVGLPAHLTRRVHLFFYGPRLRKLLRDGWDVIHCWEEPYIVAGGQVAWWAPRGTPLVYRTAQSNPRRYPPPFGAIERYAMGCAAGWICSGKTVAHALQDRAGYRELPGRRIPLGVDLESFCPDSAAGEALRRSLGWDANGPPVVGYVGRFTAAKGLHLLMDALDDLASPWRALFVGAGELTGVLRQWSQRHGDRVRICTDVAHDAVPRYLNAMDVLCAPSQTTTGWREQFGRVLIEAYAVGVPVIGSDSGEVPYLVRDTGVIVGEQDTAGWTQALAALLGSPARRRDLAAEGIDRARTEYAWPVVAAQYLEFFEELLAQPAADRVAAERVVVPDLV